MDDETRHRFEAIEKAHRDLAGETNQNRSELLRVVELAEHAVSMAKDALANVRTVLAIKEGT